MISVADSDTSQWQQAIKEIYSTFPVKKRGRLCIEIENPFRASRRTTSTAAVQPHHARAFESIVPALESRISTFLGCDALGFGGFYRKCGSEPEAPTVIVHVKENVKADWKNIVDSLKFIVETVNLAFEIRPATFETQRLRDAFTFDETTHYFPSKPFNGVSISSPEGSSNATLGGALVLTLPASETAPSKKYHVGVTCEHAIPKNTPESQIAIHCKGYPLNDSTEFSRPSMRCPSLQLVNNTIADLLARRDDSSFMKGQIRKLRNMKPCFCSQVLVSSGVTGAIGETHLDWALFEIPKSKMFLNKSPEFNANLIPPGHNYVADTTITGIAKLEIGQLVLKKGISTDVTLGRVVSEYHVRILDSYDYNDPSLNKPIHFAGREFKTTEVVKGIRYDLASGQEESSRFCKGGDSGAFAVPIQRPTTISGLLWGSVADGPGEQYSLVDCIQRTKDSIERCSRGTLRVTLPSDLRPQLFRDFLDR